MFEIVSEPLTVSILSQGGGSSDDTILIGLLFALILTVSILGMAR